MRIEESPTNEVDHFELQAASFESVSYNQSSSQSFTKPSIKRPDTRRVDTRPVARKPTKKKRNQIRKDKSSDSSFYNSPYPGIPSKQTGTAIDEICKGGTAILDLLEKNVCPADFIDSPTMRRLESNTILWDLQNKIDGVDHKALLKILNGKRRRDIEEKGLSSDDFSASSESCPPSPVSFSDVQNIISDLENDSLYAKNNQLNGVLPPDSMFQRMSLGSTNEDCAAFAANTVVRNRKSENESRKALRSHNHRDKRTESKQSLPEPSLAKTSIIKHEKPFLPPSELQTRIMYMASSKEIVPSMVNAKSHEGLEHFDHMSTLTEERNPLIFPHLHETRSCVPSMRKLMMKIRSGRSTSSISSAKVLGQQSTAETETPSEPVNYVYGYETANHAYVAFLERGGSEFVKMYEHPAPPSFEKMSSEVLVMVDVSTVSPSDGCIRRGEWWGDGSRTPLTLPIIPGSAFVGTIESEGDRQFQKGDRVLSLVRAGANSRHIITDSERLVKVVADDVNNDILACLPEIYLSAFQGLHYGQTRRYRKNALWKKNILILGGVSTIRRALVEVAKAAGADAIYVTGREKEFRAIASVGGLPLSKDPRHWLSILMGKMDVVIGLEDPYGTPQLKYEHIKALHSNGKVVVMGGPNNPEHEVMDLDPIDGTLKRTKRKLVHYNVFDSWESNPRQAKKDLLHLVKLAKYGALKPQIAEKIPLNQVAQAHDGLDDAQPGFVLCEPWIIGKKPPSENGAFPTSEVLW
jgi:NADPH:quinone reductase-like Zn-dependent oxidoreductase